jgi:hypothetical protein
MLSHHEEILTLQLITEKVESKFIVHVHVSEVRVQDHVSMSMSPCSCLHFHVSMPMCLSPCVRVHVSIKDPKN